MKTSPFQIILMAVFGLGALIGLFMFATYKGGGSANAAGPVLIWGTLPKAGIEATIAALSPTDTDLKGVTYIEKSPDTLASELATEFRTQATLIKAPPPTTTQRGPYRSTK